MFGSQENLNDVEELIPVEDGLAKTLLEEVRKTYPPVDMTKTVEKIKNPFHDREIA
jgi:hypothetical protein